MAGVFGCVYGRVFGDTYGDTSSCGTSSGGAVFGCVYGKVFGQTFGDTSSCGVIATVAPPLQGGRRRNTPDFYREPAKPRHDAAKEEAEMLEFVRAMLYLM